MVEFALQLKEEGFPIDLYLSDCSKYVAGFCVSNDVDCFLTPKLSDGEGEYVDFLFDKCSGIGIDVVVPLLDYELQILAHKKDLFYEYGTTVIVSDPIVIQNCMNKSLGYEFCIKNDIPVPKSYFGLDKFPDKFPVIKKRIMSSASMGLFKILDKQELSLFKTGDDMLQEFISGKEYGVDILNDLQGDFVHACIKEKFEMRAGETDKSRLVYSDKIYQLSRKISHAFKHIGNMDVDIMEDKSGNLYCIDFNPRFGGGYPATHLCGYNYLKAVLDMCKGLNVEIKRTCDDKEPIVMKGISLHMTEN
jgi:carbamoyl-phosphate synthase large subunit